MWRGEGMQGRRALQKTKFISHQADGLNTMSKYRHCISRKATATAHPECLKQHWPSVFAILGPYRLSGILPFPQK